MALSMLSASLSFRHFDKDGVIGSASSATCSCGRKKQRGVTLLVIRLSLRTVIHWTRLMIIDANFCERREQREHYYWRVKAWSLQTTVIYWESWLSTLPQQSTIFVQNLAKLLPVQVPYVSYMYFSACCTCSNKVWAIVVQHTACICECRLHPGFTRQNFAICRCSRKSRKLNSRKSLSFYGTYFVDWATWKGRPGDINIGVKRRPNEVLVSA